MDDTISRQAAIEAVRQYCIDNQIEDGDYHSAGIEYELNNLPSVQQWIPVSERLPDTCESVIVSVHDDSGDSPWNYTSEGWMTPGKNWVVDNDINFDVVAWMPLPRPWKGERKS